MASTQRGGRDRVLTGDLPDDFLRFNAQTAQGVAQAPGVAPVMYPNSFLTPMANAGRLSITVVQAKLAKNYGLTRMDPYCRLTIGNHVFETPTDNNGAANPRWNKLITSPLPKGVNNLYVEIFDERSFSMDERIAWGLVTIKDEVLQGETLDDWYSLSGKQGEEKEGMINLVFAHREVPVAQQPVFYQQQMMPVMVVPQGMVSGVPVVYPAHHPQGGNPQVPQRPSQPTQQDMQNLKDMFPNMEESVIRSVLEASGNNVDAATTHLLTMTDEDQANAT